ncbi:MAG: CPBP family intramembrane metalloprotease [Proteobacteria bacterium]|nr:CPBP family intramembrane metalloprotease [Pseudomonadota bacterium]
METDIIEIKTLTISVVVVIFFEFVVMGLITSTNLMSSTAVLGLIRLLELASLILVVMFQGRGLPSIGLVPTRTLLGLERGMIWSVAFGILVLAVSAILFFVGLNPIALVQTKLPVKTDELVLFILIGGILGPIVEEILFRGILYGFFRRWGIPAAIALSTIIFVLVHPINGSIPVVPMVGGILFAGVYELEQNLVSPIAIHIMGNLAIFALSLVA